MDLFGNNGAVYPIHSLNRSHAAITPRVNITGRTKVRLRTGIPEKTEKVFRSRDPGGLAVEKHALSLLTFFYVSNAFFCCC